MGFVLIGLGGISTYHASQQLQHAAELREVEQRGEMNAQLLTLMMKNQELMQKEAQQPAGASTPDPGPPPAGYFRPPSPPPPVFAQAQPQPAAAYPPGSTQTPEVDTSATPASAEPPEPTRPPEWQEPASIAVSGRYLTGRQRQVIADTLRAHGVHTVTIESSYGDEVSQAYAEELGAAFADADWVVRGIEPHRGLPLASGVTISAGSFPPLAETRAVYEALLAAGIAVTQQLDPKQGERETVVLVGTPL